VHDPRRVCARQPLCHLARDLERLAHA
jgi:hypothetical protein